MNLKRLLSMLACTVLLVCLLAVPAMAAGIEVNVPSEMTVYQGEELDLYCSATYDGTGTLSYIWYETVTGKLDDMIAINRGEEINDTYRCDTSEVSTRYYLCSVSDGASAVYSDIITVRVLAPEGNQPVVFTADSEPVTDGKMTVDIEKMTDYDSGIYNAFLENNVGYQWYRDGKALSSAVSKTLKFSDSDAGHEFYVTVKGYGITLTSDTFVVERVIIAPEIETAKLPDAIAGEPYSAQIKCYDNEGVEFGIYYNPGKSNQFDDTGLKLAADGKLSGTPEKAGKYVFTVCAANDGGEDYATYTFIVTEPETQPTETTQPTTAPTTPTTPEESTPAGDDLLVIAPAPGDSTVTIGAIEGDDNQGGGLGLILAIVVVSLLAIAAAVTAVVLIVILIIRKKRG